MNRESTGSVYVPPHWQRVIEERAALAAKLDGLEAFLATVAYQRLGKRQADLLKLQADAMTVYLGVLDQRLALAHEDSYL